MYILPDTNIWAHHYRERDTLLEEILRYQFVIMHPIVIGELAMANYGQRKAGLQEMLKLPKTHRSTFNDVMQLIVQNDLHGRGLQWNDAVLLTSTKLSPNVKIWTRDRRLRLAAEELGVAYIAD